MDDEAPYNGTQSGLCGCMAALAFALPVGMVVVLGAFMGDCLPDQPCKENVGTFLTIGLAVVAAVAALLGFSVRAIVRWNMDRKVEGGAGRKAPVWAFAVASALSLLAAWSALDLFSPL